MSSLCIYTITTTRSCHFAQKKRLAPGNKESHHGLFTVTSKTYRSAIDRSLASQLDALALTSFPRWYLMNFMKVVRTRCGDLSNELLDHRPTSQTEPNALRSIAAALLQPASIPTDTLPVKHCTQLYRVWFPHTLIHPTPLHSSHNLHSHTSPRH